MIGFAPSFSFKELTHTNTGFPNQPNANATARLRALSYKLQILRDAVGKPLYINSAFRSDAVNRAVGGVRNSLHLYGCAVDVSIRNLTLAELKTFETAIINSKPCEFIKYDTFYHIGYDFSRLGYNFPNPVTFEEESPELYPPINKPSKTKFDL